MGMVAWHTYYGHGGGGDADVDGEHLHEVVVHEEEEDHGDDDGQHARERASFSHHTAHVGVLQHKQVPGRHWDQNEEQTH